MRIWSLAATLVSGLLGACAPVNYDTTDAGTFDGNLLVMWVGEGSASGDGKFVFVPDPRKPLTFKRPDGRVIRPGMMYTDGGSIPPPFKVFKGFFPWGYAPAYMIHDWIFVAENCVRKDREAASQAERDAADALEFKDSAEIMAEAIKALVDARRVAPNDVAASSISLAVAGPISRNLWDHGTCKRVDKVHEEEANASIPGSGMFRSGALRSNTFRVLRPDGTMATATPGRVVAEISF